MTQWQQTHSPDCYTADEKVKSLLSLQTINNLNKKYVYNN